ncbi:MAG: hypothetical protein DMF64_19060 [Acidobacteria bacterium]|nr:MAG: hypothetical protein DMF64_19060 [Acidobacteriota bacterium]
MKQRTLTLKQQSIAEGLAHRYGIDTESIHFLNADKPEEPWLTAESLIIIARQSAELQTIDEGFDQFIDPLLQIVHYATVVTKSGQTFRRSGVATINEREDMDAHRLAAGRAVSAVLTAAGFHPLHPGVVADLDLNKQTATAQPLGVELTTRQRDLKRIHVIAQRKGLLKPLQGGGYDRSGYKEFLIKKYGINTAISFDEKERASLINALEQLPDAEDDEFAGIEQLEQVA